MSYGSYEKSLTQETIIPEWYLVKREILTDFFILKETMQELIRKPNPKRLIEFSTGLFILYITVRTKVPPNTKNLAELKEKLKPLENSVKNSKPYNPNLKQAINDFISVQELLDYMKLTDISFKSMDSNFALG